MGRFGNQDGTGMALGAVALLTAVGFKGWIGGSRAAQAADWSYPDYPFYVVHVPSQKIVSGWDYREDAQDDLDERKEFDQAAGMKVYTAAGAKRAFGGIVWRVP